MKRDLLILVVGALVAAYAAAAMIAAIGRIAPPPTVERENYVVADLLAEIAAREAELDDLADILAKALGERDEAIAILRSAELVIPVEMPDGGEGR